MPDQYDDLFFQIMKYLLQEDVHFNSRFSGQGHGSPGNGPLRLEEFIYYGTYSLDEPSLPFKLQISCAPTSAQIGVISRPRQDLYAQRQLCIYHDKIVLGWDKKPIKQASVLSLVENDDFRKPDKKNRPEIYFENKVKIIPLGYAIETFYSIECHLRTYPPPNPWNMKLSIFKTEF